MTHLRELAGVSGGTLEVPNQGRSFCQVVAPSKLISTGTGYPALAIPTGRMTSRSAILDASARNILASEGARVSLQSV